MRHDTAVQALYTVSMHWIVILMGGLICAGGLVILVSPDTIKRVMRSIMDRPFMVPAAGFRIVFGILFLIAAPETHAPRYVQVLGVLFIIAGLLLLVIGRDRIIRLIELISAWPDPAMRAFSLVAFAFGASIVWAGGM